MIVKFRGEEIEVEYNLVGDYIAPSYEDRGEYPEVYIEAVYYNDVDVIRILTDDDLEDITELILENLYE